MSLAANLHDALFAAIEQRYAEDADLLQICGKLFVDFVPDKDEQGNEPSYPAVVVSQGEEGGSVELAAGLRPVCENFVISFAVAASSRSEAAQIAWQIAKLFGGDAEENSWEGEYDGVKIFGCERDDVPVVTQVAQGECEASVRFIVRATSI